LPNIVPPGRAEVVTDGTDVGKDKVEDPCDGGAARSLNLPEFCVPCRGAVNRRIGFDRVSGGRYASRPSLKTTLRVPPKDRCVANLPGAYSGSPVHTGRSPAPRIIGCAVVRQNGPRRQPRTSDAPAFCVAWAGQPAQRHACSRRASVERVFHRVDHRPRFRVPRRPANAA